MNTNILHFWIVIVSMGLFNVNHAQEITSDEFQEKVSEMQRQYLTAKEHKAHLYDAQYFKAVERNFTEIQTSIQSNKNNVKVSDLQETIDLIHLTIQHTDSVLEHFGDKLTVKEYGLSIRADSLDTKNWKKAEESLKKLLNAMGKNETEKSTSCADDAYRYYNQSIITALNIRHFDEFETLLDQHDKDLQNNAPITLQKALLLRDKAKSIIDKDKMETEELIEIVNMAYHEINHAINIMEWVEQIKEDDITYEQIHLNEEERMQKVASLFDLYLEFDQGTEKSLEQLTLKVRDKIQNYDDMDFKLAEKDKDIDALQIKIDEYKNQLTHLSTIQDSLIVSNKSIRALSNEYPIFQSGLEDTDFTTNYENEQITIRIPGSIFVEGKEFIKPQNYGPIVRIANLLCEMSNCVFTVEGHTDSQGKAEKNREISQKRADAIKELLCASASHDQNQFVAFGLGESKPLSPNDSVSGRTKNNRIDIVIRRK